MAAGNDAMFVDAEQVPDLLRWQQRDAMLLVNELQQVSCIR